MTTNVQGEGLRAYLVTLYWGAGLYAQVEVNAFTPRVAEIRGRLAGIAQGWFDLGDEVDVEVVDETVGWVDLAEEAGR